MFTFFKKKSDDWLADAKTLRQMRQNSYKILTREEIKEKILEEERIRKGEGRRSIEFTECKICKEDRKALKKLGYYVYESTQERLGSCVPCVYISW